jgi:hypothetical protein
MTALESFHDLVEGRRYRIISGFGEGEVGICRSITNSAFGLAWGQIETPVRTRSVRWNLLEAYPTEPERPRAGPIWIWMCPTCGEQAAFAGFCENNHDEPARLIYRSCVTVDQIMSARDDYIRELPEARATIESFLEMILRSEHIVDTASS